MFHNIYLGKPFSRYFLDTSSRNYFCCKCSLSGVNLTGLNAPPDKRKWGDDYCRLSNKENVITAVKVVITAHPQESKFENFNLNEVTIQQQQVSLHRNRI
jgi:hypothetical protein